MLFKPELVQEILKGHKRQTRRIIKPGQEGLFFSEQDQDAGRYSQVVVFKKTGRDVTVYKVGKDYAVCPGRGKRAVWYSPTTGETGDAWLADCEANGMNISIWGEPALMIAGYVPLRIRITTIRSERACDISEADARAEGFANRDEFLAAWDRINGKGKREAKVWCLSFEVCNDKR